MVQLTTFISTLALTIAAVNAAPNLSTRQNLPDPSGEKNIGNGRGIQFIGGQCNGAADCGSGCCATLPRGGQTIGVCSGLGAQRQAGKQGCGFESGGGGAGAGAGAGGAQGGNQNNNNNQNNNQGNNGGVGGGAAGGAGGGAAGGAAGGETPKPSTLVPDPAGAGNVGNGAGRQFITGGCTSDADCGSGCCAIVNTGAERFGICSGVGANTQNGKQ
ncbi:hypothetical protein QBC38DRAFT_326528, partial [Podospora fimiseda]